MFEERRDEPVDGGSRRHPLREGFWPTTGAPWIAAHTLDMGHHHHKRKEDCEHGWWATSDVDGHHHHKLGHNCVHGVWATDSVDGHHHHKRHENCSHGQWATSEGIADAAYLTDEEFSDDPSIEYDLTSTDKRSYAEIEAELASMAAEHDPK